MDTWIPQSKDGCAQTVGKDIRDLVKGYRETCPLSEAETSTQNFYRNIFSEHLGWLEPSPQISLDVQSALYSSDEEERDSVKVTASCEKKDISSHLEPGIISAFTTACETDTLSDFQQLPSDEEKCAEMGRSSVLSENGIKHLLVWMSGDPGVEKFQEALLKGVLCVKSNSTVTQRLLLEDRAIQLMVVECIREGRFSHKILEAFIDILLNFDNGSKLDGCQVGNMMGELVLSVDTGSPVLEKCLERMLQICRGSALALDDFGLEVSDSVLLGAPNMIDVVGAKQNLLFSLSETLKRTSISSQEMAGSTRYGKFVLNVLKKLPKELPKNCCDDLTQAVQAIKSFLKRPAEAELKKHIPI